MSRGSDFLFFEDKTSDTIPRPGKFVLASTFVHDYWRDQLGVRFVVQLGYSLVDMFGRVMR